MWQWPLLAPFYSCENWGLKKFRILPGITTGEWQGWNEPLGSLNSEPVLLTIYCLSCRVTWKSIQKVLWAKAQLSWEIDSCQGLGWWKTKRKRREVNPYAVGELDVKYEMHQLLGSKHPNSPWMGKSEISGPRVRMTWVKMAWQSCRLKMMILVKEKSSKKKKKSPLACLLPVLRLTLLSWNLVRFLELLYGRGNSWKVLSPRCWSKLSLFFFFSCWLLASESLCLVTRWVIRVGGGERNT